MRAIALGKNRFRAMPVSTGTSTICMSIAVLRSRQPRLNAPWLVLYQAVTSVY
jgi:hypothetical protein